MDALTALWLTSIIGAVGFTATGFFLARSRMLAEVAGGARQEATATATPEAAPARRTSERAPVRVEQDEQVEQVEQDQQVEAAKPAPAATPAPRRVTSAPPPAVSPSGAPRRDTRREDSEPMLAAEHATDVVQSESERPRRGGSLAPVAPAAQTLELERQLHALRVELRSEVVARDKIEMHARELAARLTSMTTQMSSMRARASDETGARRRSSIIPAAASDARTRLSMRAPGLFAEIDELKATIARLTAENDSLRRAAAAAAAAPPARSANARTDLVEPEVLEELVRRIIRLDNVRAAAVADTGGLVLAGSGELANALAAFGASMKDAATRSERLLPLKLTEEVTVRDTQGFVFSTQVLGPPEAELALVTLAQGDVPVHEMREIVAQTPGLGGGALPAR